MKYVVLQIAPGVRPDDPRVPKGGRLVRGSLVPVSCDGYYRDAQDAHQVAEYLFGEYPRLQTMVVEILAGNDPRCNCRFFPPLKKYEHEAPPAFLQKAAERARMTPALRYEIIRRDGYRCRACGFSVQDGARLHVDHIYPVSKGGKTERENLQTLCSSCNIGKRDQ
jgi:hypothetical protein